ncbi:helix-turn-helix domain-containing protein [Paraburkholderia sp. B3]|uniref:helix-turn-helix transcriptional regulator n=1 Tax=Paraburkholderia sp. B3 TaxID=3134791 RepID=UPI003981ED41
MDYPIKTLSQLRPILVGFRKEAGLTQEAIARRLGISQQSYAAFEANPETASVERLFRVLRQFDAAIRLGAPEPSERSAPSTGPATPPARMQARAGRKEADAASQPAPAKTASSPSRKRRSPSAAGSGTPRAQRPAGKTREDW